MDDALHDGPADDGTLPVDLGPRRRARPETEPAVAAALAVVERSLGDMARRATRPLLDPPTQPYRLRPLGTTGLAVFPVVLDASAVAAAPDRTTAHRVLDAYAAAGGNALLLDDTADGAAAQTVGTWLKNRDRRGTTVLGARVGVAGGLTAAGLQAAVRRVLQRLDVDRLDLLVLAGPEAGTPLEETLTAAAGLLDEERVGHVVAGGHAPERLIEARVLSGQRGLPRFEAVAPVYSLLDRAYEVALAQVVHAQDLACLPRSPLADGLLAGAAPSRGVLRRLRETEPGRAGQLQPPLSRRGARTVEAVLRIARDRDVPPAAVALAWLLTRPRVVAPIVPASGVEQVWAATAAAQVHLSRAEATALERAAS